MSLIEKQADHVTTIIRHCYARAGNDCVADATAESEEGYVGKL
jgi:hypothetical protein